MNIPTQGELIYVDFPTENHAAIQRSLTRLSSEVPACPQEWRTGSRSSGFRLEAPRTVIIGSLRTHNALETQAIVKGMIKYFKDIQEYIGVPIFIGRQGLFSHPDSVIVEGIVSKDLHIVQPVLGEALMVNLFKLVYIPWGGADPVKAVLTEHEELHLATFRYRKSHPKQGDFFARADALEEQVRADRRNTYALRQPESEAERLQSQVLIEVVTNQTFNFSKVTRGNHFKTWECIKL